MRVAPAGGAAATSVLLLFLPMLGAPHVLARLRPLLLLLLGEGPLVPSALPPCLLLLADPLIEGDAVLLAAVLQEMLPVTVLPVWGPVVQGFVLVPAGTAMRRPKATTYAWAAAGGW